LNLELVAYDSSDLTATRTTVAKSGESVILRLCKEKEHDKINDIY